MARFIAFLRIELERLERQLDVASKEGIDRLAEHLERELRHLDHPVDARQRIAGGRQVHRPPGDRLGVVAHALELRVHLGHRHDEPQLRGDRHVTDQELLAQPVDVTLHDVDAVVGQDDGVGEPSVALGERDHRVFQAFADQIRHGAELSAQDVHVPAHVLVEIVGVDHGRARAELQRRARCGNRGTRAEHKANL
jgi:hypothetical protein